MNDYSLDSTDSGLDSDPLSCEMGEISINDQDYNKIQYLSRSYIEMPQTGEVNYISTIIGVCGNPIYKGKGLWVPKSDRSTSSTVKVDKDDIRAKRHYVKTLHKDGREVKIWECGLCGKEFRFQYTLVRHIPTHTDVRNYQCDICPKAFRQLSTLAQHKATHWNMRPFSCDFCQKSFNRISTLISHKKIHYDEKKHVCPFCGKGFHQKGNLRNHMYTHTNERPYKCDICNKGFNQKSNLVCHKISTHSRKDHYQCHICNIKFGKQNLYSCHMESIHNVSINFQKKSLPSTLWENMKTEPQCAIVDEANNIIYSLPISFEDKKNNYLEEEEDITSFGDELKKKDFPIIANHMDEKNDSGNHQVFILPSHDSNIIKDFENRDIEDSSSQITLHNDSTKICISDSEVFIVPKNSFNVTAPSSSGIKKSDAAIIYTKTQPNIRPLKMKRSLDMSGISETATITNELMTNAAFNNISGGSNNKSSTFMIYVPQGNGLENNRNKMLNNKSCQSDDCVKNPSNGESQSFDITSNIIEGTFISRNLPEVYSEPEISDYRSLKNNSEPGSSMLLPFYLNICDKNIKSEILNCKEEKIFETEVFNNTKQTCVIKKEVDNSEILSMEDPCNDIEPSLFINSENIEKESLSKFSLDFDSENFDILDDYNFTDSFLDSTDNNNVSREANSSIVDTFNPSSPASFIFSSL